MKKNILLSLFLLIFTFSLFAEKKSIKYQDYNLNVFYKDLLQPGDAVFVRLNLETKNKKFIKNLGERLFDSGALELYRVLENGNLTEKTVAKAKLYEISYNKTAKIVNLSLLSAVPLSTYAKTGDYVAKISFSALGKTEEHISVPIKIIEKEFISETIPLNATNTAIRTNNSDERKNQIERLNAILGSKNYGSVYETSRFVPPNPATRRTSFFGDRRVFAYSNGKSSTSLHYGIDYGIPTGSEVRACGRGKVVMAENRITTGWSICVEHLPGLYSLYYHMDEMKVSLGQIVEKGELIGLSGCTGLATGPHLHWEVRLNMEAISPDFMTEDFAFSDEM